MTERRARIRSTVVKGLSDIIRSLVSSIEAPQYEIRIQRCWRETLSFVVGKLINSLVAVGFWVVTLLLEWSFEVSYALLVMLIVGVWFAIKGIRSVPESGSLKSFVEAPVHSAMSFGTPGISEISRKKSALVVFRVSYAHCIFSIIGVLSFKLNRVFTMKVLL